MSHILINTEKMPVDVRVAYQVRMQLELQVLAVTNTLHDAFCDIICSVHRIVISLYHLVMYRIPLMIVLEDFGTRFINIK